MTFCAKPLAAKIIERQEAHTLTAVFGAEQLPDNIDSGQAVDFLARQLIRQTDSNDNDGKLLKRWRRRIDAWVERIRLIRQTDGNPDDNHFLKRSRPFIDAGGDRIRPGRFLIVIDGVNQRPKKNWGRIIEVFRQLSEKAGGRLLVTCRSHYFRTQISGRLSGPVKQITVPEWTAQERDELLKRSRVDPTALDQQTARSLLNPRLLGIALQILPSDNRGAWQGLTVARLFFEHIRAAERDNADHETFQDFADRLTRHAQEALGRVHDQHRDDLLIFEDQLEAVAEGRFFAPIPGPRNAYELRQEGLSLALGFALADRLICAKRNGNDLSESVGRTLELIATLDDTARVVLASLTAVTMNENWFRQDIYEALIGGFVFLQNLDAAHYPAFVSLAKEQVEGFLNAAETLTLQKTPPPNSDWIKSTLFDLREDEKCRPLVASAVTRWLSYYTLDPEQEIVAKRYPSVEERQKKIEEKRLEIKAKLESLCESERQVLEEMHEKAEDQSALTRLAIRLLAGRELAPYARAFVRCSFSAALNSPFHWPYEQFRHLLNLNTRDWASTRNALLEESRNFRADNASRTGKRALVRILNGGGNEADMKEASALVKTLRRPLPWPKSWRLVEEYCSVDPCDPSTAKPSNVVKTATKYQQIDVTKLHAHMGHTPDDVFFEDALPAIARFFPEVAIEKHVQLLDQLFVRRGLLLRQVALIIDKAHRPLIDRDCDRDCALKLVDILRTPGALAGIPEGEQWIIAQILLLFASPSLTASEQWEAALLTTNDDNHHLLSLCYSLKPLDEHVFEQRLRVAVAQDDRAHLLLLLTYAQYSGTPLTRAARSAIAGLVPHKVERIRTYALGTIYNRCLSDMLPAVVASGWRHTMSQDQNSSEPSLGSLTLIDAASKGVADPLSILDRLVPTSFDVAVQQFGPEVATEIARRYLTPEKLTIQSVGIVDGFSLEAFDALYGAIPEALHDLADLFLSPGSPEQFLIHNLALLTAYAISKDEPEKAKSLFENAGDSKSFHPRTAGYAKLTLEQRALWKSAANPLLDGLRSSRLDHAVTDHELAMEVLAAEQAGRQDILDAYIKAKCGSDMPAIVARGLMVAGFCDDREKPAHYLTAHAGRSGLIGAAHHAAQYAFERNRWARHWYQKMSETEDPAQYWVNKCLFAKIVDGRFTLWEKQKSDPSSPLVIYREITEKAVKDRCEKWKRKREEKLFGQDAPEPLFVR